MRFASYFLHIEYPSPFKLSHSCIIVEGYHFAYYNHHVDPLELYMCDQSADHLLT